MNKNVVFSEVEQQVEKLKEQGLIFSDEEFAKRELQLYGYSNLIKSYREPYLLAIDGKKIYRSGATFEQIRSLYLFDKNLRNAVMAAMLDLEEHVKETVADVVSKSFGVHQDSYLNFENYRDKKKRKYRFTLSGILQTIRKSLDTGKAPVFHYIQKYHTVPPWILFKNVYFSTVVNFVDLFKPSEKMEMVSKLYNFSNLNVGIEDGSFLMMDTLFVCIEYRNLAAHGGRIYNYRHEKRVRFTEEQEKLPLYGFSQFLLLLSMMKYKMPYKHLERVLLQQLTRHCNDFPEDFEYLKRVLDID